MKYQVARSFWERLIGVIGKGRNFKPLFIPKCRQVHTFWMKDSIDIFWVNIEKKVIKINRSILPRKICSCCNAYGVLEAPLNKIKNIKLGDKITDFKFFSQKNEEGSVITEFALILPVLIILIFGFLQLSLVLADKLRLTHTVNYATFVGATTNDNTKVVGALSEYYDLSDINYTIKSLSARTEHIINDDNRKHNDILQLEIIKKFPIQIPLMTITNIDINVKSTARIICTNKIAPYVCD
jgi:uncharacterized membrane protein (UPF0127 family)